MTLDTLNIITDLNCVTSFGAILLGKEMVYEVGYNNFEKREIPKTSLVILTNKRWDDD